MPEKEKKDSIIIGVDYGTTNIGISLGRNGLVIPVKVINGKNDNTAINEISRLVIENKADKIVVGLPLTAENKETKQSILVRRFSKILKHYTKKPVEFVNEFSSTIDAEEEMFHIGVPQKKRSVKDHFSAALILHRYYTEHQTQ